MSSEAANGVSRELDATAEGPRRRTEEEIGMPMGKRARWRLSWLLTGLAVLSTLGSAQGQSCSPETGSPPSQVILGDDGSQFFPENRNCPKPIVAPQCAGGTILRYVDPLDPDRLTRYACVASPPGGEDLPLVVYFHGSLIETVDVDFAGYQGNPPKTDLLAHVNTASLAPGKTGYVLLMPQGRCLRVPPGADGDGMHHDEWFKDGQTNLDIRAAQAFIQQLQNRVTLDEQGNPVSLPASLATVDDSRIYLTGHSNGAFFAHLVGLLFPQQFAALATAAGADPFARGPCPVAYPPRPRKIPVMVVHAACDPIVLCDCYGCDPSKATVEQWFDALARLRWPPRRRNDVITSNDHTRVVADCQFSSVRVQKRRCPLHAHDFPNPQLPSMFRFLQRYTVSQ